MKIITLHLLIGTICTLSSLQAGFSCKLRKGNVSLAYETFSYKNSPTIILILNYKTLITIQKLKEKLFEQIKMVKTNQQIIEKLKRLDQLHNTQCFLEDVNVQLIHAIWHKCGFNLGLKPDHVKKQAHRVIDKQKEIDTIINSSFELTSQVF